MVCSHLQTHTHTQTHVGLCGVYNSSTLQTVAEDRSSFMWVLRLIRGPNSFALLDAAHLLNSSQHLNYETDRSEATLPVMAPWGSLLAPISASSFLHMSHSRWAAVELSPPRQVSTWLMVLGFSHRSSRQPMIRLCMFFGHTWQQQQNSHTLHIVHLRSDAPTARKMLSKSVGFIYVTNSARNFFPGEL